MKRRAAERKAQRDAFRKKWHEDRDSAERTLERRRERYQNDPAYRESIKESVRRQRASKPASDRKRSFNRDRVIVVDGQPVVLWSIGKSSKHIGISRQTLEKWERERIIPKNRCTDEMGRRWFPATYIEFLAQQHAMRGKNERLSEWSTRVEEAWASTKHQIPLME